MRYIKGVILIEFMIANCLNLILIITTLAYLQQILDLCIKTQIKFKIQNTQLLARHYLAQDMVQATYASICNAKSTICEPLLTKDLKHIHTMSLLNKDSDVLTLHTLPIMTIYYLRKSAVPGKNSTYALYRDPITSHAQAIVEDILRFTANMLVLDKHTSKLQLQLELVDHSLLEMTCLYKSLKAMS